MKEQLLQLIKELELLRAQAEVEHNILVKSHTDKALEELFWAYKYVTEYE